MGCAGRDTLSTLDDFQFTSLHFWVSPLYHPVLCGISTLPSGIRHYGDFYFTAHWLEKVGFQRFNPPPSLTKN